jgi:hypothetical protein
VLSEIPAVCEEGEGADLHLAVGAGGRRLGGHFDGAHADAFLHGGVVTQCGGREDVDHYVAAGGLGHGFGKGAQFVVDGGALGAHVAHLEVGGTGGTCERHQGDGGCGCHKAFHYWNSSVGLDCFWVGGVSSRRALARRATGPAKER